MQDQSSPCDKSISGKTSPSTIGSALPNSSTPSAPTSRTIPSRRAWPLIPRTGPGPAAPPSSAKVAQTLLAVQPPTSHSPAANSHIDKRAAPRNSCAHPLSFVSSSTATPGCAATHPHITQPQTRTSTIVPRPEILVLISCRSLQVAQTLLAVQPPTPT